MNTLESHFVERAEIVKAIYDMIVAAASKMGPVEEDPKKTSIHLNRKYAFAGIQSGRKEFIARMPRRGLFMAHLKFLLVVVVLAISLVSMTLPGNGEGSPARTISFGPTPSPDPAENLFKSYRGVSIGMSAEQARQKLGAPKERSNSGDYYVLSHGESVQLVFEKDLTIKSLTVNYTGDLKGAPSPRDVFGIDVKKEADGSITKMLSFPKDGYWASFVRTSGKDTMIVVTLQKLAEQ